jgi:hypothetical protein
MGYMFYSNMVSSTKVSRDVGVILSLGYPTAEELLHLNKEHNLDIMSMKDGKEFIIGPFSTMDNLYDFINGFGLLDHLHYIKLRNEDKINKNTLHPYQRFSASMGKLVPIECPL